MKREIKFRAWNKKKSIMAEVSSLFWNGNVHVSYQVGEPKDGFFFGGNWVGDDWANGDFELMQYTGLKDKNGKEIYEGDILSNLRRKDKNNWGAELVHDTEYSESVEFRRGSFATQSEECLFQYCYSIVEHRIESVVIGNIYENPELINL